MAYASKIKFLGYGVYKGKFGVRFRVHTKSQLKYWDKLKELTSRWKIIELEEWKRKLRYAIVGWVNYYKLADMWKFLAKTDEWLRRRIRMVILKKWKRVRTKYKNVR